jgi:phenol hydroxylase P3 protein
MTRGLGWETTYQSMDEVFPYAKYEGIKIHDWDKWEDPFRLTMDAYWKYQAEKERKLYAIIDAYAQNNGHLSSPTPATSTRQALPQRHQPAGVHGAPGFAHGPAVPGRRPAGGLPDAVLDEIRHAQTQIHALSNYNKYYNGLHDFATCTTASGTCRCRSSFFDDAITAGPFEFMVAIGFSFEYVLTNLLFVPFMSGAAYNGDMGTMTFGFSAQSDEARHMTLGLEVIKFMLEQDPDNVPIVQRWIDKWTWRGYRVLTLVGMMMDYMLPKRIMSWKEAWEVYFEQNGGALFKDLARYGIRRPSGWTRSRTRTTSPTRPGHLLQLRRRVQLPHLDARRRRDGLAVGEVPNSFDKYYRPRWSSGASRPRRATASTTRRCPCCARPARSPCCSPSRATRPDLLPRGGLQGRQVPLLLRRLQRDLRARAREVRPGLAAGAPDLPGQLLQRGVDPTAEGLTRWLPCSTTTTSTSAATTWT